MDLKNIHARVCGLCNPEAESLVAPQEAHSPYLYMVADAQASQCTLKLRSTTASFNTPLSSAAASSTPRHTSAHFALPCTPCKPSTRTARHMDVWHAPGAITPPSPPGSYALGPGHSCSSSVWWPCGVSCMCETAFACTQGRCRPGRGAAPAHMREFASAWWGCPHSLCPAAAGHVRGAAFSTELLETPLERLGDSPWPDHLQRVKSHHGPHKLLHAAALPPWRGRLIGQH